MTTDTVNPGAGTVSQKRRIEVVPYSQEWPELYSQAASCLREIFGDELVALHHIGSTAVVGLHAKPIIDILPEVRDIARVARLNPLMIDAGYRPRGENGIAGRRYFVKESGLVRTHHVHVFQQGHPEIARHVDFVAYLNACPEDAARYADLKQKLARRYPQDSPSYVDGKTALIRELDARAVRWKSCCAQEQGI